VKIEAPGQMETPTNTNYNDEPISACRRFYIDHFLFLEDPYYRLLLARVIGRYVGRVGRLHLTFKCSGGCVRTRQPKRGSRFLTEREVRGRMDAAEMSILNPVDPKHRFSSSNPCPICGGYPSLPHGQGVRCTGFVSAVPNYVHCTREEYANGIPLNEKTTPPTYVHRLKVGCRCGVVHDLGKVEKVYDYRDNGTLVQQVVRYNPKNFRPRIQRPDGGWRNTFPENRVIYNLDAVRSADGAYIVYCEGEKDADTCSQHGLTATTHAGGANGWRSEFASEFVGKKGCATTSQRR